MKLRSVRHSNRKRQLELVSHAGRVLPFPYARLDPEPTPDDRIEQVRVDPQLGREAVTYRLQSGAEGSVHVEQALEYNRDPRYMSELLTYRLTLAALERIDDAGLSRREIARRLHTSVPQLYRLLDPTNTTKTINQMVSLLHVLDCHVDLTVQPVG